MNLASHTPEQSTDLRDQEILPQGGCRPVRAAQYLRMSTELQQYSLANQADAIRKYAEARGFAIIKSYVDSGKSGLMLKHRQGLTQLLSDVVAGSNLFRAILVYDVSRWGRFQDTDESAHYEFLCKTAGIPIHYCAETFVNDGKMPNVVMKTLKRVMAAEYSRELSCKVFEGLKRLCELGFRTGGPDIYGYRRLLCTSDRIPKQVLNPGQRKAIFTDRVISIPGPPEEVKIVREVFRMVIDDRKPLYRIAEELNKRGIKYFGRNWITSSVAGIVKNPKYTGINVWARHSQKFGGPKVCNPESTWIVKKGALEPLVDEDTFNTAQETLRHSKSDKYLIDCLKILLADEGYLSQSLILSRPGLPDVQTYYRRFGSIRNAFALAGYCTRNIPVQYKTTRRIKELRAELVLSVLKLFQNQVRLEQKREGYRPILHFEQGPSLLVVVCKSISTRTAGMRWLLDNYVPASKTHVLLARCNHTNTALLDYYLVGELPNGFPWLREDDPFLRKWRSATDVRSLFGKPRHIGPQLHKYLHIQKNSRGERAPLPNSPLPTRARAPALPD